MKRHLLLLFILSSLLFLQGCGTIQFYTQAIHGQISILRARQPIQEVLDDDSVIDKIKQNLKVVIKAKAFAEKELGLDTQKLYSTYVQLDRPYVLWNVFATPEFSITPKKWCFPLVGCLSYRGYFLEEDAIRYAASLKKKGYDVYVGGVAAYSTLGWFNDPILSSFFKQEEEYIAGLLFHELSHQLLYFDGDTTFNESFATTVELESLKRFLESTDDGERYKKYLVHQQYRQQFIELAIAYREKLDKLYRQTKSDSLKSNMKTQLFAELKASYRSISQDWPNPDLYWHWLNSQLNNAKLNTLATYNDLVEPLQILLLQHHNNLPAFYEACIAMKDWSNQQRRNYLLSLKPQVETL